MPKQEDPPYLEGIVPDSLRDWADDIWDYLARNRVVDGPNVFFQDAAGGGKQPILAGVGGGVNSGNDFPFKIYLRKVKAGWQRGVRFDSPIQKTISHTDTMAISGELSGSDISTATGWQATAAGDLIWIQIAFNTAAWPTITTASIASTSSGGSFTGGEIQYVDTNPGGDPIYVQSVLRIPLGLIAADTAGNLFVRYQYVESLIILTDGVFTASDASGGSPRNIGAKWRVP